MLKLIVFDLDGTLSKDGYSAIPEKELTTIKELEKKGVKIAICSGKPTHYLCGFLRQCDWKTPIMMGENGSVVQFGICIPPKFFHVMPYSEDAKQSIRFLKEEIDKKIPDMWYQPGLTALTPFPKCDAEFEIIDSILKAHQDKMENLIAYKHNDCYDIVPNSINKGAAVKWLCQKFGFSKDEVATVGDGINDYSMFKESGLSFGINIPDKSAAKYNVSSLKEALDYINSKI